MTKMIKVIKEKIENSSVQLIPITYNNIIQYPWDGPTCR